MYINTNKLMDERLDKLICDMWTIVYMCFSKIVASDNS